MLKKLNKFSPKPHPMWLAVATLALSSIGACSNNTPKSTSQTASSPASTVTASAPAPAQSQAPASASVTPPAENNAQLQQTLATNLTKSGINAKILSVTPTSMPNMYWVKAEGLPAFFTDPTGQYIVQGDIIKVGGAKAEHITADLMAKDTKTALASIDKKDMIIFPAKGATKKVIYAFTDVDCGYCRKLHAEIEQINGLGIEVRYLPWPRSEQTFPIMESVWCSQDRNTALTQAKQGIPVNAPSCANPVRKIHELGLSLGVNGTPAIFSEDGHQLGGYLPPAEMAKALGI
ncbi:MULTISPECIES: thioredoxin fold domain-containing protein [unclassified Moraxella]|uniref:thioredoxin fold domain-containing protein n=1 Tax=unclassified Moraxella TaxID=2685852 RepID=UPI003AF90950